jgi:ribose transport system substrate-binding protein
MSSGGLNATCEISQQLAVSPPTRGDSGRKKERKMKRKVSFLALLIFGLASVAFAADAKKAPSAPKKIRVGVLWCTLAAPAVQDGAQAAKKRADELGIELISLDAQLDAQKQSDQALNLIAQKVDAIILNPVDAKSLVPAAKKIAEAKIPLIVEGMRLDESGQQYMTSFVGGDELAVGRFAGNAMVQALGPKGGKVVIVEGALGSDPQIYRTKGFEEEIGKVKSIAIIDKQSSSWDRAKAMAVMEDFLIKYSDIAGVWVHDDNMAMGVVEAIKAAGKTGKIKVISYNGNRDGVAAVKNGEIYATAVQPIEWEGRTDIDAAVAAVKGEMVKKWYKDSLELITKDNVGQFNPQW